MNSRITSAALLVLCTFQTAKSFGILPTTKSTTALLPTSRRTRLFSSFEPSFENHDSPSDSVNPSRLSEFADLEPLNVSEMRRQRFELDRQNKEQFVDYGNDLWELRSTIGTLSSKLMETISTTEGESTLKEHAIRKELREAEARDAELVYKLELEAMEEAEQNDLPEQAEHHRNLAKQARSCLTQFNLEGLWVGKYGQHGYEIINVTYTGDTLIAYKVTGDKSVPRGEITFQANLSPLKKKQPRRVGGAKSPSNLSLGQDLEPIQLSGAAAKKWGTTQLPRYVGSGQVAEEGFVNNQWMDGQLIVIGQDYFSFAWVPIEHQIFFGRPSPELALKMLKDGSTISKWGAGAEAPNANDDMHVLMDYAHHLLQVTSDTLEEEYDGQAPLGCIYYEDGKEECFLQ